MDTVVLVMGMIPVMTQANKSWWSRDVGHETPELQSVRSRFEITKIASQAATTDCYALSNFENFELQMALRIYLLYSWNLELLLNHYSTGHIVNTLIIVSYFLNTSVA